jgi:soluble lytic murein transglycosylase-like protein
MDTSTGSWLRLFFSLTWSVSLSLTACVGPTTPFGSETHLVQETKAREPASDNNKSRARYKIRFHPDKQVLHDKTDFSIEVKSNRPITDKTHLQISYNGWDVTSTFLANAHVHKSNDNRTQIYLFKSLRLKTLDTNDIKVQVVDEKGLGLSTEFFEEPHCSINDKAQLAHLGEFHAPESYIELIERVSRQGETNPSFLAGVVAQESGFNPKAVSWAKAIGLTQITPLAENELLEHVEEWPRYPGINSLSYLTLKTKIHLGEIDADKEWRLNPEKSLVGGLTYFQYLKNYWNLKDNKKLVDSLGGNRDQVLTELILASYNSGASRVKRAVVTREHNWKKDESLKEAVRYIKKVSSYCYHYTDQGGGDDNET